MKKPIIGEEQGPGYFPLQCPDCGSNNLHHQQIEAFERSEDATQGIHVLVNNGEVSVNQKLDGNPSLRRDGLRIYFTCENCEHVKILNILQHKGTTYVNFETIAK